MTYSFRWEVEGMVMLWNSVIQASAVEPKVDQAKLDHAWLDAPVLLTR